MCDTDTGGALIQEFDGTLHLVSYMSSKFLSHQKAYATIEKDLLSLTMAVKKFDCYIQGAPHTDIYSDHNQLQFLEKAKHQTKDSSGGLY